MERTNAASNKVNIGVQEFYLLAPCGSELPIFMEKRVCRVSEEIKYILLMV
jgi:hypothetical protein